MSKKTEKLPEKLVEDFKVNLQAKLSRDKRTFEDMKKSVENELNYFYEQSSGI